MRCVSYVRHNTRVPRTRLLHHLAAGYAPTQVCQAKGFVKVKPVVAIKIGFVSLGGAQPVINPRQPFDISPAFAAWSLPAPTLTPLTLPGADLTPDPNGANVENNGDAELAAAAFSYCTGIPAQLVFASAPNVGNGIALAISALVKAGCRLISCSWGAPLPQWAGQDLAATSQAIAAAKAAGVVFISATGDNSLWDGTLSATTDFPAADRNSFAMGGTSLRLDANNAILSESAWGDGKPGDEGGGGGFDPTQPQPAYQQGIVPGNWRGIADASSSADPAFGFAVYSDEQWGVVGGTSMAAPLMTGYLAALAAGGADLSNLHATVYAHRDQCFDDIVLGSDGSPAIKGWDPPTGLGSPNGRGLAAVLLGNAGTGSGGGSNPTPPPSITLVQEIDDVFAQLEGAHPASKYFFELLKNYLLSLVPKQKAA
jgi:kumamolisin